VRRHWSGSTTSFLRCVLIIREPSDLLFFPHGRHAHAFKGVLKAQENSTPARHPQRPTVAILKFG
jgi:hypothetical protein